MNLQGILKNISSTISKPLSDIKYKTISEENINAQIDDTTLALSIADVALATLTEKQFNAAYAKVLNRLKMETFVLSAIGRNASDWISGIDKNLQGKSKSLGLYKALMLTSKIMGSMLEQLRSEVGMIVNNKDGIVINDIQVSHTLFFGAIESAKVYSSMNSYLLAVFSHILSMGKSSSDHLPRYMLDFLVKNGEVYLTIVNQLCNSGDTVVKQILEIKKQGADFKLSSDTEVGKHGVDAISALSTLAKVVERILKSKITYAMLALSVVWYREWIGEKYVDIQHMYYEWLKERKKWLEIHVANIKLQLEDMDENDPERLKTRRVVEYYDDKIADFDRRINNYYNE